MLKAPRSSTEQERLAIKAAVSRALKLAGGAASFQHVTRLHESNLSRAAAPHCDDQHLPLDVMLDLDREAQAPVVLSEIARLAGYSLKAKGGDAAADGPTLADASRIMSALHKTTAGLMDALADGAVDRREAAGLSRDIDAAIRELTALRGKLV